MASDPNKDTEITKPKGIEKAKIRAQKANAAGDAEEAKARGKSPGKLNLKVLRGSKDQGNRKGGR